jgi:hypothetical protein
MHASRIGRAGPNHGDQAVCHPACFRWTNNEARAVSPKHDPHLMRCCARSAAWSDFLLAAGARALPAASPPM